MRQGGAGAGGACHSRQREVNLYVQHLRVKRKNNTWNDYRRPLDRFTRLEVFGLICNKQ